jgi:hypothetical protein
MDDFNSETDSDYTSYWRDWVRLNLSLNFVRRAVLLAEEDAMRFWKERRDLGY